MACPSLLAFGHAGPALPAGDHQGDRRYHRPHSALRPGTRVAIEGPYGAFTGAVRSGPEGGTGGAGVGVAPLRAMLEDLPQEVDVVVVQRASTPSELILHDELKQMVAGRGGWMVELVGSRRTHRLNLPRHLHSVVPDLASRDLYVCGPEPFSDGVIRAAQRRVCHCRYPP